MLTSLIGRLPFALTHRKAARNPSRPGTSARKTTNPARRAQVKGHAPNSSHSAFITLASGEPGQASSPYGFNVPPAWIINSVRTLSSARGRGKGKNPGPGPLGVPCVSAIQPTLHTWKPEHGRADRREGFQETLPWRGTMGMMAG
jgi:hypothetical protein